MIWLKKMTKESTFSPNQRTTNIHVKLNKINANPKMQDFLKFTYGSLKVAEWLLASLVLSGRKVRFSLV